MLIEIRNLSKVYRVGVEEIHALRGVDLDIGSNEMVAIMGSSGSGKSTLMNMLGCLDTPTSGTYHLGGRNVGQMGRPGTRLDSERTDGVRLSVVRTAASADGLAERGTATDLCILRWGGISSTSGEGGPGPCGSLRPNDPQAESAVRGPEAAGCHSQGHIEPTADPDGRRTDGKPGFHHDAGDT